MKRHQNGKCSTNSLKPLGFHRYNLNPQITSMGHILFSSFSDGGKLGWTSTLSWSLPGICSPVTHSGQEQERTSGFLSDVSCCVSCRKNMLFLGNRESGRRNVESKVKRRGFRGAWVNTYCMWNTDKMERKVLLENRDPPNGSQSRGT